MYFDIFHLAGHIFSKSLCSKIVNEMNKLHNAEQ